MKYDGKEIIAITKEQLQEFARNIFQVKVAEDKKYLVMSESTKSSSNKDQISRIHKHYEILTAAVHNIETWGTAATVV